MIDDNDSIEPKYFFNGTRTLPKLSLGKEESAILEKAEGYAMAKLYKTKKEIVELFQQKLAERKFNFLKGMIDYLEENS